MGLAEKRGIKAFQDGKFQQLSKKVNEIAGKTIAIEVEWDTLAEDGMDHLYEEAWTKVYFEPLMAALTSICADDMGKEAITESLNEVVVKNVAGNISGRSWATLENNTLTLDHKPTSNIDDIKDRSDLLQEFLENNL